MSLLLLFISHVCSVTSRFAIRFPAIAWLLFSWTSTSYVLHCIHLERSERTHAWYSSTIERKASMTSIHLSNTRSAPPSSSSFLRLFLFLRSASPSPYPSSHPFFPIRFYLLKAAATASHYFMRIPNPPPSPNAYFSFLRSPFYY